MHQELHALFEEDQADRRGELPADLHRRDERRRRRVEQLLAQGAVTDPDDRWLMAGGLPQKYGTQYRSVGGRWVLYQVDPTTSDEERARWDVPPLAEALRRAEEMTCDDRPRRGEGSQVPGGGR